MSRDEPTVAEPAAGPAVRTAGSAREGERPRVLVCGHLKGQGLEILGAGCEVDHLPDRGAGSLDDIIRPYAGVIVHSAQTVDVATLDAAENLRVVGRAGVGVDNIDVEAATARGVLVMNLPWGNTVTAAEHTIGLLLALARNIPQAAAALKGGEWERSRYLGTELKDKALGLVGFGRIGREVARRAQGLEMDVLAHDPYVSGTMASDLGVQMLELDALLERVDVVSLHVPLTPETHHLIDATAMGRLRRGAWIVNCARGGLVDEDALREALETGRVGGAAFDVFESEPEPDPRLLAHPRFIGTPHLGGATVEAQEKIGEGMARQIVDFLTEGIVRHPVNVQALPPEEQRPMLPYVDLARRLGALLGQCFPAIERLRVEYHGGIAGFTVKPVTAHALVGLLDGRGGRPVNSVNAWQVARETGVSVEESADPEPHGYSSMVRVTGWTGDERHSFAGTVFDEAKPRVVEIDGLPIELAPEGHLLLFVNDDRPGVVGAVGAFLGERRINIADVRLGRDESGGEAIAVMTLDAPLGDDDLAEFQELPSMRWARTVSL